MKKRVLIIDSRADEEAVKTLRNMNYTVIPTLYLDKLYDAIAAPYCGLIFVVSKLTLARLIPAMYFAMALPCVSLYGAWLYQPALRIGATSSGRKRSVIDALRVPMLAAP